jgi:hydrogenase-4 component B
LTLDMVIAALSIAGLSGLVSLAVPRRGLLRDRVFAVLMVAAAVLGSWATLNVLWSGETRELAGSWSLPIGSPGLRLDGIAAAFLLPVFLVPALGAVYALAYWNELEHPASAARYRVFWGLLTAALGMVLIARDGVLLLFAWEAMALSAFFLVTLEDAKPEVRWSGWVYFVATHVGTLTLYAFFSLLDRATGRFALDPVAVGQMAPGLVGSLFLLALGGFGLKAGIMPLHVWLPGAHANAPSHVSALLSGVMLKAGVYGIVRVCWMLVDLPRWCGGLLIALGGLSAVLGIAFACAQRDYKRLLAYSSIENIGVIILGIGAAVLARAFDLPRVAALAIGGAVLHVWNHALFKPLLFFVAGSVLHATGTRRMNQLGALARVMPITALLCALACVGITALPPMNGFVSEWCLSVGFLRGAISEPAAVVAALTCAIALLAVTGALALIAFVKLFATVFLGTPRSELLHPAHDPPGQMLGPMALLALLCLAIGIVPRFLPRVLLPVVARWLPAGSGLDLLHETDFAHLASLGTVSLVVVAISVGIWTWLTARARQPEPRAAGTWDCGYAAPSARMQYTESSLGQTIVLLLQWVLIPRREVPTVNGLFPAPTQLKTETPDVVLDRGVVPSLRAAARLALRVRLLQQGKIQIYVLYILSALLLLLLLT